MPPGSISTATGSSISSPPASGCRSSSIGTMESGCVTSRRRPAAVDARVVVQPRRRRLRRRRSARPRRRESRVELHATRRRRTAGSASTPAISPATTARTSFSRRRSAAPSTRSPASCRSAGRSTRSGSIPDLRIVRRGDRCRRSFAPSQLQKAVHYEADTFASVYLHNDGNGTFTASPLPTSRRSRRSRGSSSTTSTATVISI